MMVSQSNIEGRRFGCVWDAIIDDKAEAQELRLKSSLIMKIQENLASKRFWNQDRICRSANLTRQELEQVSDSRAIYLFSLSKVLAVATNLGIKVNFVLHDEK